MQTWRQQRRRYVEAEAEAAVYLPVRPVVVVVVPQPRGGVEPTALFIIVGGRGVIIVGGRGVG